MTHKEYRGSREQWKILEMDEMYAISSYGRLRNLITGKLRIHSKSRDGYEQTLLRKSGKTVRIHKLVAETFIPNPKNLPVINHKNAIRTDNRVENLEWCTQSDNVRHAYRIGRMSRTGSKNNSAKLREKDIPIIRGMLSLGVPQRRIAEIYKVGQYTICNIKRKHSWNHVK